MEKELQERQKKVLTFLKEKPVWIPYLILLIIIWVGVKIRTANLHLMQDKFPLALDPYVFLRYSTYIAEHGKLFLQDTLRNFPVGYSTSGELLGVSYFTVYLHKFIAFFNSSFTIPQTAIIYPVVAFAIGVVFYFLLTKKLSNTLAALLASTFLIVLPPYLYRTMAGFADKEALALLFFFAALYFFITGWVSDSNKGRIILGVISGIFTGLLALSWGGINLFLVVIAVFILIEIILNKFSKERFYSTLAWLVPTFIMMSTFTSKYGGFSGFFASTSTAIVLFVFFIGLIDILLFKFDLFKIKHKIEKKMPAQLFSLIVGFLLLLVVASIAFGPGFVPGSLSEAFNQFVQSNVVKTRWTLTVAESHQPYLEAWIGNTNWLFLLTFIGGAIYLFFRTLSFYKSNLQKRIAFTAIAAVLFIAFIFSRYSASSLLNGVNGFSIFLYVGAPIIFILIALGVYIHLYKKDKETFNKIKNTKSTLIFALAWFFIMMVAARSQVRLFLVFAPVTAFLAAYLIGDLFLYSKKFKDNAVKIAFIGIAIVILVFTVIPFYNTSSTNAQYTGPSYNTQWQNAMSWVQQNTPEDAIFAHWWDYGYWVQTGGNRATLTDGGNNIGAWNYYMGRHVLTGQNETEALQFLVAHDSTHLLMISDEIGKYGAFSSIGSDINYDRYSWISTYHLDPNQMKETRNATAFIYSGGAPLDEDFIYQGQLFPKQSAGVAAFVIPITTDTLQKNISDIEFQQPLAAVHYKGALSYVPIQCIYFMGEFHEFDDSGLKGCLRILPAINGENQVNILGSLLYVSERVRRGLFAQLYLFNKPSEHFKLVHDDSQNFPLAIYQGRVIGPLKIWEISYPDNIETDPIFLSHKVPDSEVYQI